MKDGPADGLPRDVAGLEAALEAVAASAHDLNNLITVVVGHAALLERRIGRDDPSYRDLESISLAGARAAEIARDMLALGNRRGAAPERVDLEDLLSGIERTLRRLSGHATLVIESESPGCLEAQRGRLVQLLLALVAEARDTALPGSRVVLRAQGDDESAVLSMSAGPSFPAPEGMASITDLAAGLGARIDRTADTDGAELRLTIPRRR